MKTLRAINLLVISLFISSSALLASPGDGGDDPDFPNIPLDGGLSILLVTGAAYGAKKLYDNKKKEETDN